jgi:hypothetical protein
VIDAHSGMDWALAAGRGFDEGDVEGRAITEENGTVHRIPEAERADWEAAAERATERYIAELDAQGLPGSETLAAVKGHVAACREELGR